MTSAFSGVSHNVAVPYANYSTATLKAYLFKRIGITMGMSVTGSIVDEHVELLMSESNPGLIPKVIAHLQNKALVKKEANRFDVSTILAKKDTVVIDAINKDILLNPDDKDNTERVSFKHGYYGKEETASDVALLASASFSVKNEKRCTASYVELKHMKGYERSAFSSNCSTNFLKLDLKGEGTMTRVDLAEKCRKLADIMDDTELNYTYQSCREVMPPKVVEKSEPEEFLVEHPTDGDVTMLLPTTTFPIDVISLTVKNMDDTKIARKYHTYISELVMYNGSKKHNSYEYATNAWDGLPLSGMQRERYNIYLDLFNSGMLMNDKIYIHTKDSITASFIQKNMHTTTAVVYYNGDDINTKEEISQIEREGGILPIHVTDIPGEMAIFFPDPFNFTTTGYVKAMEEFDRKDKKFRKDFKELFERNKRWLRRVPYYAVESAYIFSACSVTKAAVLDGPWMIEYCEKEKDKHPHTLLTTSDLQIHALNLARVGAFYLYSGQTAYEYNTLLRESEHPVVPCMQLDPTYDVCFNISGVQGSDFGSIFGTLTRKGYDNIVKRAKSGVKKAMRGERNKTAPTSAKPLPKKAPGVVRRESPAEKKKEDPPEKKKEEKNKKPPKTKEKKKVVNKKKKEESFESSSEIQFSEEESSEIDSM